MNEKRAILIVEDDLITQKVLAHKLKSSGFEVYASRDGLDSLELVQKHAVAVVIVDMNLPHIQGDEIMSKLKEAIPGLIVYATSIKKKEYVSVDLLKKVNGFLQKPYTMKSLNDFIDDVSCII